MKNQKSTMRYYDFEGDTYEEVLKNAKKLGYKFLIRWINSDESWVWFQTTYNKAKKFAIDLYMGEKRETNIELAKQYYCEYIDIIEVSDEVKNI